MKPEDVWYGEHRVARVARALLTPLAWIYRGAVAARNSLYDRAVLSVEPSTIPVISVGNLSVGGTGKTPITAYIVRTLAANGHTPAVVLRGYGGDETTLHARLNPHVRVIASADRAAGIALAARGGADVVVLDDGFQHRRAARELDIVLVSADQWTDELRMLPAGPLREPFRALARARLVIVTRKVVALDAARRVAERVRKRAGLGPAAIPIAIVSLTPDALVDWARPERRVPLSALADASVFAIAGVGDPSSFVAQLEQSGATVTPRIFADHHPYDARDVSRLAAESLNHKYVVTTEKDAVKLGPLWAAKGTALWYVSQAVAVNDGASLIDAALRDALSRRLPPTAG